MTLLLAGGLPASALPAPMDGQGAPSADASALLLKAEPFALTPDELNRISASIPSQARYGARILLEDRRVSLDDEGRATGRIHTVYRVDHESALQAWSVIQAGWLPWLEDRPVLRARVVTPDGLSSELDPATLGESQPGDGSTDMFQDHRVLRGPLPKLKVGSLVEMEILTREHRPFSACGFRRSFPLCWTVPAHQARLVVELPASAPLKSSLHGLPEDALRREVSGNRLRLQVDRTSALPPRPREPHASWDQDPLPSLTLATAPSWAAVADEYRAIVEARLKGADLAAWVAEAVGDAREPALRIERILARLQAQVRYVGLEFGEAAIVPVTPAETLRRGYGDCKDKATLLVALLRQAGFEAHVALLRAGEDRDFSPEFPGLAAFNHAIVRVGGRTPLWIDPSVSEARAGELPLPDRGRNVLVISKGTKATTRIPAATPGENTQTELREVFLEEEGAGRIVETSEARGAGEIALRGQFAGADPAKLKESLRNYIRKVYTAEVLERSECGDPLDLGKPFRLVLEARKAAIAFTSETDARVSMNPWPLLSSLHAFLQPGEMDPDETPSSRDGKKGKDGQEEAPPRRTDLLLPHAWGGEHRWILHPPSGYAADSLPEPRHLTLGPARLDMDWKAGRDGTVDVTYRFACAQTTWTPAEVEAARAALKTIMAESVPTLYFQQVGEAHLGAGRLKEALAEFRALAASHPTSASALIRLAKAQLGAGLGESARESLHRAIALEPNLEAGHRQLGWTLQHDALGRRFSPGWDRAGAIASLRKAVDLAPDLRAARLDLGIVLEHDAQGARYASRDLEEAQQLYRDQLAKGKDDTAQELLTSCLARQGRFEAARAAGRDMEAGEERNGWVLAMDACVRGCPAAIQEARRVHQDLGVRRGVFRSASDILMRQRRYLEAGILAGEGADGTNGTSEYRARADRGPRMKAFDALPLDRSTPTGALLALARGSIDAELPPERFFDLLSPAQRPVRMDREAVRKALTNFHHLSSQDPDWRNRRLDEAFSVEDLGQDGSPASGFRIQTASSNPLPTQIYVSTQKGTCRVVTWGNQPPRLGREALWDLDHGNLEGACAWLDRAMDTIVLPPPQDPFSGSHVVPFWTKGMKGTPAQARLAAAILVLEAEEDAASRRILEEALPGVREPLPRAALLSAMLSPFSLRTADPARTSALEAELGGLFPDLPSLALTRVPILDRAGRFEEALALCAATRKAHPDVGGDLADLETRILRRMGRMKECAEVLRREVRQGKADGEDLNALAWDDVVQGTVTEQTVSWAQHSVTQQKEHVNVHTLACALAELGRFGPAREALLGVTPDDAPPLPVDYYVYGRIAEGLEDPATARACYGKVLAGAQAAIIPDDPGSCETLARKRLALMDAGTAGVPAAR